MEEQAMRDKVKYVFMVIETSCYVHDHIGEEWKLYDVLPKRVDIDEDNPGGRYIYLFIFRKKAEYPPKPIKEQV